MDHEVITGGLTIFNVIVISFFLIGTPAVWAFGFGGIALGYCVAVGLK